MQAVMVFLAVAAVVGARAAKSESPIPRYLLIAASIVLALALTSRHVV